MQSLSRHRLSISRFHNKCHQDQGPQAPSPFLGVPHPPVTLRMRGPAASLRIPVLNRSIIESSPEITILRIIDAIRCTGRLIRLVRDTEGVMASRSNSVSISHDAA